MPQDKSYIQTTSNRLHTETETRNDIRWHVKKPIRILWMRASEMCNDFSSMTRLSIEAFVENRESFSSWKIQIRNPNLGQPTFSLRKSKSHMWTLKALRIRIYLWNIGRLGKMYCVRCSFVFFVRKLPRNNNKKIHTISTKRPLLYTSVINNEYKITITWYGG